MCIIYICLGIVQLGIRYIIYIHMYYICTYEHDVMHLFTVWFLWNIQTSV